MTAIQATFRTQRQATLRLAREAERDNARAARAEGDVAGEWRHLERAHVLSQPVGNTGGVDVSASRPMPIPDDLRPLLGLEDPR